MRHRGLSAVNLRVSRASTVFPDTLFGWRIERLGATQAVTMARHGGQV